MATTLTNLITDVRLEIGNPSTTAFSDAQITARINYSYYEIATRYRHPELEANATITTAAGTQGYSLPTGYWHSISMLDTSNENTLLYRPMAWFVSQDLQTTGNPKYYTRHGSQLLLYPTPNGVYSITNYYRKRPTALASGSDTTIFDGIEWDEIVKWGAVWRCYQTLKLYQDMIQARNVWRTLVDSLPETEVMEAESTVQIIPLIGTNMSPHILREEDA